MPNLTLEVAPEPFVLEAYARYAQCVHFAHTGDWLVTSGFDPHVKIWNTSTWSLAHTIVGHANAVNSLLLTRDESTIFTTSTDATTRMSTFPTGDVVHVFTEHRKTVTDAALSPDETLLATASYDGRVVLYDLPARTVRATLKGSGRQVTSLRFSPDGRWLASAGLGEEACVWSVAEGEIAQRLGGHRAATGVGLWLDGGARLTTHDYEGALCVWESGSWRLLERLDLGLPAIASVALAPAIGVAAVAAPHTVALFDVNAWERLATLSFKVKGVYSVAWTPDASRLAASGADGRVRVWEVGATS